MALDQNGTVSERHAEARADGDKITAGQLAAAMRKRGLTVTAAELKPLSREWHHAGWTPRGGMGRCYFFPASYATDDEAQQRLMAIIATDRAEAARTRYGFAIVWRVDRAGPYGRKRYVATIGVREFAPGKKMGKYEEITEQLYRRLLPHAGADLEPFEPADHAADRLAS